MSTNNENKIKITFTVLLNPNGHLTKEFNLLDNNTFDKRVHGSLYDGYGQVVSCSFIDFGTTIRGLKTNECICHGTFNDEIYGDENGIAGIVRKYRKQLVYPNDNTIITRTKDYFNYPEQNALVMLDYDPAPGSVVYSVEDYIKIMSTMIPGFENCAKVITPSTSACMYDLGGNCLSGEKPSFHLYFVVKESLDITRFKETLFKRCILNGLGYVYIKRNSSIEIRTIFDKTVFSQERPDFVAGAVCGEGLIQRLPNPIYLDGGVLDTSCLVDLSDEEEVKYNSLVYDLKKPFKAVLEIKKEERIQKRINEKNVSDDNARNYTEDLDRFILWNEFELTLDSGQKLTVEELLTNGEEFDGVSLYDPIEPEKGPCKAKFYWNDGHNSQINSFLHGDNDIFTFKQQLYGGKPKPKLTEKPPTFGTLDTFLTEEESRKELERELRRFFSPAPFHQFLNIDAGLGKTHGFLKALSEALKETTSLYGIRIAYFVPDNALSLELLKKYTVDSDLIGMPCLIRGRTHYSKDFPIPTCKNAELILKSSTSDEEYLRKASEINGELCKNCRYRKEHCEYFNQFKRARNAHIVFFPHKYLFSMAEELVSIFEAYDDSDHDPFEDGKQREPKRLIDTFTHIVIDEDIIGRHILDTTPGVGVFSCNRIESDVVRDIINDLERGASVRNVLGKYKSSIKQEYNKHRIIKSSNIPPLMNVSDLGNKSRKAAIQEYKDKEQKRIFWRLLKDICEGLDNSKAFINNVWVDENELKVGRRTEINSLWLIGDRKILFLDASANTDIVQKALGYGIRVTKIKTHIGSSVQYKQICDNIVSSTYIENNYNKIANGLLYFFNGSVPPIITGKKHEEQFVKIFKEKGVQLTSRHFNDIRGTDDLKNSEDIAILGRYTVNPKVLNEKARLLYPATEEPLDFTYDYQEFVYRMKDGSSMAVKQKDYMIGGEIWNLNNHLSRAETEQAIARIRPFSIDKDGPKEKTVYIFTSQVLDITVDELLYFSDIFPTEARETGNMIRDGIIRLLNNRNGILKWEPELIAKILNIDKSKLNTARKSEWFLKSSEWRLVRVSYETMRDKSRKQQHKEKFLILNKPNVSNSEIQQLISSDKEIFNFTIDDGW